MLTISNKIQCHLSEGLTPITNYTDQRCVVIYHVILYSVTCVFVHLTSIMKYAQTRRTSIITSCIMNVSCQKTSICMWGQFMISPEPTQRGSSYPEPSVYAVVTFYSIPGKTPMDLGMQVYYRWYFISCAMFSCFDNNCKIYIIVNHEHSFLKRQLTFQYIFKCHRYIQINMQGIVQGHILKQTGLQRLNIFMNNTV